MVLFNYDIWLAVVFTQFFFCFKDSCNKQRDSIYYVNLNFNLLHGVVLTMLCLVVLRYGTGFAQVCVF